MFISSLLTVSAICVVIATREEQLILGAIILLRAALTFLIQWEIKIERKSGNLTEEQVNDIKTPLTQDVEADKTRARKRNLTTTKNNTNTKKLQLHCWSFFSVC